MSQAKQKAEKNRQKAEEEYERLTHSQRQEAAQLRREEKRRAEKERLLNEEDPDKARKLEVRFIIYIIKSLIYKQSYKMIAKKYLNNLFHTFSIYFSIFYWYK